MTRLLALVWPALRAADADQATFDAMLDRLDDLSPRIEAVDRGVALLDITGLGPLLGEERRIAARAVALARGVAPLTVQGGSRGQPLAGGPGRAPGAPHPTRRAGRLPRARCRGAAPTLPGPAPRRPGDAREIRPLRADQHGAAGRAPAVRGRRPVRAARRTTPAARPRPRPAATDPAPPPGAAERQRRLRAAGAGDHRDRPLPAPPRGRAVRRAARPPPGARPSAPRPETRRRALTHLGAGAPRTDPRAGLDRTPPDRSPRAGQPREAAARRKSHASSGSALPSTTWRTRQPGSCPPSRRGSGAGRSCAGRWNG